MAGNSGNPIDTDLIASNVRDGVDIFGVTGNYQGVVYPSFPANTIGKFSPFAFAKDGSSESLRASQVLIGFVERASDIYAVVAGMAREGANTGTYFLSSILKIEKATGTITEYQSPYFYLTSVAADSGDSYIRYDATNIYIGTNHNVGKYVPFDTSTDSWGTPSGSVFQDEGFSFTTLSTTTSADLTSTNIERFAPDAAWTGFNPGTTAATATLLFSGDTYSIDCKYFAMDFPDVGGAEGLLLYDAYLLKS